MVDFLINWISIVPSFATPFVLAALGLIICERSGVLNLGAEGFMLVGALAGVGLMVNNTPALVSLIGAMLAGSVFGLMFALMVAGLRINHVISGLALVFLAQALTSLIATQQGWTNNPISGLNPLFPESLSELPIFGSILFGQDIIVYITPFLCFFVTFVMYRTKVGLNLRAVGENPYAADAAGINVTFIRFLAIVIGGALLGLAGGYLTVAVSKIWVDGVVGGRGWIAIALVIFARWGPWRALVGALLFGCIEALIPRIAAVGLNVPQYFLLMTPYLATLGVMIWTAIRLKNDWSQPSALGQHHIREERT